MATKAGQGSEHRLAKHNRAGPGPGVSSELSQG